VHIAGAGCEICKICLYASEKECIVLSKCTKKWLAAAGRAYSAAPGRPMAGFRGRRGVEKERGGNRNEDLGGKIAPPPQ